MPDRFNDTDNMRADLQVKSGANKQQAPTGGPAIGGLDNPRADQRVKSAANKTGGPTGGKDVGGLSVPGKRNRDDSRSGFDGYTDDL